MDIRNLKVLSLDEKVLMAMPEYKELVESLLTARLEEADAREVCKVISKKDAQKAIARANIDSAIVARRETEVRVVKAILKEIYGKDSKKRKIDTIYSDYDQAVADKIVALETAKLQEKADRLERTLAANKRRLNKAYKEKKRETRVVAMPQIFLDKAKKEDYAEQDKITVLNENSEVKGFEKLENLILDGGYVASTLVQCMENSLLLEEGGLEERTITDGQKVLRMPISRRIISLSIGNSFTEDLKNQKALNIHQRLFNNIESGRIAIHYLADGSIKTVTGNDIDEVIKNRKVGEDVIQYKGLMVTSSGFGSGVALLGAVAMNGKNCDRRYDVINNASQGAVAQHFTREMFNELIKSENSTKLFKELGRIAQTAAPQRKIGQVKNYILFKNFQYNKTSVMVGNELRTFIEWTNANGEVVKIDVTDSKDGVDYMVNKFNPYAPEGMNQQTRGTSAKRSTKFYEQWWISAHAKELVYTMECPVAAYCVNGKEMSYEEFHKLPANEQANFYNNVDMLTDLNAKKLKEKLGKYDVTGMKIAKDTETGLSAAVVLAMMEVDEEGTSKLLKELMMKSIAKRLEVVGLKFEIEAGELTGIKKIEKIMPNANTLVAEYLMGIDRWTVLDLCPMLVKGTLEQAIEGAKNELHNLKFQCDAIYSVVQSDIASSYGVQIIKRGEIFSLALNGKGINRVAIARHPISTLLSFSTLKVIGLEEVLERIDNSELSGIQKKLVKHYFINSVGNAIMPSDKYYQEKHDGMDYDIDAIVIYVDEKVVDILSKIPDVGIEIIRNEHTYDHVTLPIEEIMEKAQTLKIGELKDSDREIKFPTAVITPEEVVQKISSNKKALPGVIAAKTTTAKIESVVRKYTETQLSDACLDQLRKFQVSSVTPIGMIANEFFNNACLYKVMNSNQEADKKRIAEVLNAYYGTKADGKAYVSPIPRDKNGNITVSKVNACEVSATYAASKGSIEDTRLFLKDCCDAARYPAETSIDAMKNAFQIANIFKHSHIIVAYGSNKNMKTVIMNEMDSKTEFDRIIETYDMSGIMGTEDMPSNIYNIRLLGAEFKGEKFIDGEDFDGFIERTDKKAAIVCPLSIVREEMTEIANLMFVAAVGRLEAIAFRKEAKEMREEAREQISKIEGLSLMTHVVKNISMTGITVNDGVKKMNKFEDSDGVKASKIFEKETVLPTMKNLVTLALEKKYSKENIGYAALYVMLESVESADLAADRTNLDKKQKPKAINSNALKIFEDNICEALSLSYGKDGELGLYGFNYERIESITDADGKYVKIDSLVGNEIVDGFIADNEIKAYNKKADLNGVILEIEGEYFIASPREQIKNDPSKGLIIPIQSIVDGTAKAIAGKDADEAMSISSQSMIDGNVFRRFDDLKIVKHGKKNILVSNDRLGMMELSFLANRIIEELKEIKISAKDLIINGIVTNNGKELTCEKGLMYLATEELENKLENIISGLSSDTEIVKENAEEVNHFNSNNLF